MTETGQAMHGGRLKGVSREFPIFESLVYIVHPIMPEGQDYETVIIYNVG